MVLYYKKIRNSNENENIPAYHQEITSAPYTKSNVQNKVNRESSPEIPPISTITKNPIGVVPNSNNKDMEYSDFEQEIHRTPLHSRKELYYSLLEDNFNNLSTDDKLIIMYKSFILSQNTQNNYILICLAVLVLILLKLYSN
jgi:hypothetical protein